MQNIVPMYWEGYIHSKRVKEIVGLVTQGKWRSSKGNREEKELIALYLSFVTIRRK